MVDKGSVRGKRLFRYFLIPLVLAAVIALNIFLSHQRKDTIEDILLKNYNNSTAAVERSIHSSDPPYHSPENLKHSNFETQKLPTRRNQKSAHQIVGSPNRENKIIVREQFRKNYTINISPTTVGPAVSWNDFILHSLQNPIDVESNWYREEAVHLKLCQPQIVHKLKEKTLNVKDIEWCKWATSSTGGKVVVGSSWGNLRSVADREKFDSLNCNSVITSGINPSCDDAWGDGSVIKW